MNDLKIRGNDTVVPFRMRLEVKCPACKGKQKVEFARAAKIWFPIGPYCCKVMECEDGVEWNEALDKAIEQAKQIRRNELLKAIIRR